MQSCILLSKVMGEIAQTLRSGITGVELDKMAEEYIRANGGYPSFLGYDDFPNSLCISINDEVVHGLPKNEPFKDGDIVSIDCGVFMNGFHGDMAYTFGIGTVKPEIVQLMKVTKDSLYIGIAQAVAGKRTGDIGFAVQDFCERIHPYKCVRELVGHGVGRTLHEDPQVPNFGRRGEGSKLLENLVIAIEPMINLGKKDVYTKDDDWTVATQDGKPSAHFEHTILVKPGKAEILTSFEWIEKAVKENAELVKL